MSAMPNSGLRLAGSTAAPKTAGYVAPKGRLDELRRRRTIRSLFRDINSGRWKKVLLDLGHAQHRYREIAQHSGKIEALLSKVNLVRLAFRFHATVAAANPIDVVLPEGSDEQAAAIEQIRERCLFDTLLQRAIRSVNIDAEAPLRVSVDEAGTVINLDDPDCTLPVGPNGPDGQPTVWERRWIVERKDVLGTRRYLRVERHRVLNGRGVIEQEAYTTDRERAWALSDVLVDLDSLTRVDVAQAMEAGTDAPPDLVETGASYPLIVRLVADIEDGEPAWMLTQHDLDIIDEAAAAFSRLSRVHSLHAQPLLRVSDEMVDKKTGKVVLSQDAILDREKMVDYIAQNFSFEHMLDLLDRVLGLMMVMLQMSQALLGFKPGGGSAPDTVDKLRLESTSTLARAAQTESYCAPALGRLFTIASQIDARLPLRGYAVAPVTVEMHPDLPKDSVEVTREVSERLNSPTPLISHRAALARLYGDRNADAMLEEIKADQAERARQSAASLMLGGGGL